MKKPEEVVALVVDFGIFVEIARTLGRTFKKVYYYTPWEQSFPTMDTGKIGYGCPEIELVESPFDVLDKIDLAVFPDIYFGSMQKHFIKLGIPTWGSNVGELLEIDRDGTKRLMKKMGLPVNDFAVVEGLPALREYLKYNEDKWIKTNKWRGMMETFHSPNYGVVEPKLDELEHSLGAFKHIVKFMVESPINDALEAGIDGYCIDGKFPKTIMSGFEIKDKGYVGEIRLYDSIPEVVTRFDRVMQPVFANIGYRGFYSTEVRVQDGTPFMVDFCARGGNPPNSTMQVMFTNLADIIWSGANGIVLDPIPLAKFGAEIIIKSDWALKNWQTVEFPKDIEPFVKLQNMVMVNNKRYIIPQAVELDGIGSVVGYGDTIKEAIQRAKDIAEEVEGFEIEILVDSMDEAEETVAQAKRDGVA